VGELSTGSGDLEQAERLGVAVAVLDCELGLKEDGAVMWSSLGFRLLASRSGSLADLNQALGYFGAAVELLRDIPGERAAAVLTSTLAGNASAWSRVPGGGPPDAVMAAAREAASRCSTGGWTEPRLMVLQIWADLLRHRTLKDAVELADATAIRDLASAVLGGSPLSDIERYWATEALALCELRLGEATAGTAGLREAARLAHELGDVLELGRSLSSLSDQLVRSLGPAAYDECNALQFEAAAAYAAGDDPHATADAYRTAAMMAIDAKHWERALDALRRAIPLYEAARERTLFGDSESRMIAEVAYVHHAIALCLVRLGRLDEAASAADAARARRLRSIPRRFSPGIAKVRERAPELAKEFLDAHRRLREAEADQHRMNADPAGVALEAASEVVERLRASREETRKLLKRVRAVPGVKDVFEEPSLKLIRATLPAGAVAAYLVPTPHGGVAILVGEATLEAIPLPGLTTDCLFKWLDASSVALDGWRADPESVASLATWEQAITDAGRWAWEACMGPVLERCRGAARLVLLPGAGLEFLPLHAAWSSGPNGDRRYALDAMPISYSPCADLQRAACNAGQIAGRTLLAVADPRPVGAPRLESARAEVEAIAGAFQATRLEGEEATERAIVAALPDAEVVHLACHARVEFGNPYASFLLTACDARLEFSDLVDLELPRRPVVFLSACETGLRDIELADEVQSLAAGFLVAGASEVISTLWSVFDVTGLLAALMVYDRRLAGDDGLTALRAAQLWLREVDNQEKAAAVERMAWIDPALRARIAGDVRGLSWEFSSPVDWAAFVYSGP